MLSPAPERRTGQVLLIDADDTLWENSLYFEEAIARFISFVDHKTHTAAEVRDHLNRTEQATIAVHGYGLLSFRASLTRCLEDLLSAQATDDQHGQIATFVAYISEHPLELLDGVAETLEALSMQHTLVLVTKGNRAEQNGKLLASGLAKYFQKVEVLREKDESAYRELADRHVLPAGRTWMIGNSPKSDINPALASGLNAVHVPHPHTWVLEHEVVQTPRTGQVLLEVSGFRDLRRYF